MPDYTQRKLKRGYKSVIHYPPGGANVPTLIICMDMQVHVGLWEVEQEVMGYVGQQIYYYYSIGLNIINSHEDSLPNDLTLLFIKRCISSKYLLCLQQFQYYCISSRQRSNNARNTYQ